MSAAVPQLWRADETCAILAGGPSLTPADVAACRGRWRVLAIKDTIRLAPWADVLYACDARWWRYYGDSLRDLSLPKYALEGGAAPWAVPLRNTGDLGLELDPTGLRTGKHSGYQAINLAVHLGARRLVLLGYDLQPAPDGADHWFGAHPYPTKSPPYADLRRVFSAIVAPLQALGVEVINATRRTALDCFPCCALEAVP